jgi:hypothetical protein
VNRREAEELPYFSVILGAFEHIFPKGLGVGAIEFSKVQFLGGNWAICHKGCMGPKILAPLKNNMGGPVDRETVATVIMHDVLSLFSTTRICSREQRKKQLDWLAINTDDITMHPITFAFRLFARKKSPSGKRALYNCKLLYFDMEREITHCNLKHHVVGFIFILSGYSYCSRISSSLLYDRQYKMSC